MPLKNTKTGWGWVAISFHWVSAVLVFFMFGLGLYMVELDYYDAWYQRAPDLHRSIGVLLCCLTLLRLGWRLVSLSPKSDETDSLWERKLARVVHGLLYVLLFGLFVSGYLISTADGRPINVFDWFSVPSLISDIDNLEDNAGKVHLFMAWSVMFLVGLHMTGALKHHFVDKDTTLRRMLGL